MRDYTKGRSCLAWWPVLPGAPNYAACRRPHGAFCRTSIREGRPPYSRQLHTCMAGPTDEVRTRILQEGLAIGLVIPAVSLRYRLRVLRLPYPTLILTPDRVTRVPSAVTFSLPLQVRSPVCALVLAERLAVGGPESPVVLVRHLGVS